MGAGASKASRTAGTAARKYPTKPSNAAVTRPPITQRQSAPPPSSSDGSKSDAIKQDAMDPDTFSGDFAARLQQMGTVQPNPTYSPSSTAAPNQGPVFPPRGVGLDGPSAPLKPIFPPATSNRTLSALESRRRLQQLADADADPLQKKTSQGRRFVDMRTLLDAIRLRESGASQESIERRLRLEPGLLVKLGPSKIISHASVAK